MHIPSLGGSCYSRGNWAPEKLAFARRVSSPSTIAPGLPLGVYPPHWTPWEDRGEFHLLHWVPIAWLINKYEGWGESRKMGELSRTNTCRKTWEKRFQNELLRHGIRIHRDGKKEDPFLHASLCLSTLPAFSPFILEENPTASPWQHQIWKPSCLQNVLHTEITKSDKTSDRCLP